jgi:formyltetrahydrofolate hydrolase
MARYAAVGGVAGPIVCHETVGTVSSVTGFIYKRGCNIMHTHLDFHPPSTADYLHEIQSRLAYYTLNHVVVTTRHIWNYSATTLLLHQFNNLIINKCVKMLAELISSLTGKINNANKEFIKNDNCFLYIRELKDIGFNVSVQDIKHPL